MDRRPVLVQKSGRTWATTRMPFSSGVVMACISRANSVTGTEISSSTSRRVRYVTRARRFSSMTWPSTHVGSQRAM